METLEATLQEVENIPSYLPNCLQLQDVITKAKKWIHEAEALQVTYSNLNYTVLRALVRLKTVEF